VAPALCPSRTVLRRFPCPSSRTRAPRRRSRTAPAVAPATHAALPRRSCAAARVRPAQPGRPGNRPTRVPVPLTACRYSRLSPPHCRSGESSAIPPRSWWARTSHRVGDRRQGQNPFARRIPASAARKHACRDRSTARLHGVVNLFVAGCYTRDVGEASTDSAPMAQPTSGGAPGADDAGLIADMARGDGAALATLYDRHGQGLFGYLLRLAGDRGTAEEILQDTLLAAWRSAGEFAGRSAVRTWLFGIGRRQAHNRLRGKRLEWVNLAEAPEVAATAPGPEAATLAGAEQAEIAAAMERI